MTHMQSPPAVRLSPLNLSEWDAVNTGYRVSIRSKARKRQEFYIGRCMAAIHTE